MSGKNPYDVIKSRYVTEKATMLSNLKNAKGSRSLNRCESPKYTFLVDPRANKTEIADAFAEIYATRNVRVTAVNTVTVKPKESNRRGNRQAGRTNLVKKAIITLARGDSLED